MLKDLLNIEKELPQHLKNLSEWKSVYVDYHKPYVKHLWKQVGDIRIYLHKILPCKTHESLLHPHPWPSAMKVIEGTYEMGVGYAEHTNTDNTPPIAATMLLPAGSYYEMAHINSWHYVRPLDKESFSLMITGKPWAREVIKSSYVLPELIESEQQEIFEKFRKYYT